MSNCYRFVMFFFFTCCALFRLRIRLSFLHFWKFIFCYHPSFFFSCTKNSIIQKEKKIVSVILFVSFIVILIFGFAKTDLFAFHYCYYFFIYFFFWLVILSLCTSITALSIMLLAFCYPKLLPDRTCVFWQIHDIWKNRTCIGCIKR